MPRQHDSTAQEIDSQTLQGVPLKAYSGEAAALSTSISKTYQQLLKLCRLFNLVLPLKAALHGTVLPLIKTFGRTSLL